MSSHKHKKRKKSHKHCKQISDSSDEEVDEHWTVHFSDSDCEDINNGKRLTSLVRKSYLKHLQETLLKNYEEWKKSVRGTDPCLNITKWVAVLEQKALRSCMIAELYQKNMIKMISDIKKHTQQSKLHISIEPASRLGHLLPVDQEIQCELEEKKVKKYNVETQTGKSYASLLDFPLPKLEPTAGSPVIRGQPIPTIDQIRDCIAKVTPVPRSNKDSESCLTPYNPLISFSPSENSVSSNIVNVPKMVPPPCVTNSVDKHSTSASLYDSRFNQSLPLMSSALNEQMSILNSQHITKEDILLDLQSEFSAEKENNIEKNMDVDTDNILDILSEIEREEIPSENPSQCKQNVSVSLNAKSNKISKDCLDARLTAMGLLDEKKEKENPVENKHKRSNWTLEFIAQSCNLTRIMLTHKPKQREKILQKFEKLFGLPLDLETELSDENIKICRKRIASVVVVELTPMYQSKRIGSRHLFKLLAKHATNSLMQKSYAPESRAVRKHVRSIFNGNKDIKSEADVQFLFNLS